MKWITYALLVMTCSLASATYDSTYYQAEYWSGEYPNGFSVIREGVTLTSRAGMDPDMPANVSCRVPFKAVYHPWNIDRPARFFTAAKIMPMKALEDLTLGYPEEHPVRVAKGEEIEYLIYGAEGFFTVRYKDKLYSADQELLDKVSYDTALMETAADEWLNLTCEGGGEAWVLMRDLLFETEDGDAVYVDGLDSWFRGFRDYGMVTDLEDEDIQQQN